MINRLHHPSKSFNEISLLSGDSFAQSNSYFILLQGKQSVEVAIELDMSADEIEELQVQYWRLSKLDALEALYHEAKYSLSLLLRLHKILKDKRITKDRDIYDIIELASYGLPSLRNRHEDLLNQIATLQGEKAALGTEILGLRNSIYTNNVIVSRQNEQARKLDTKLDRLHILLQNTSKSSRVCISSDYIRSVSGTEN